MSLIPSIDLYQLHKDIKAWSRSLGFQHVGVSDIDIGQHGEFLQQWLSKSHQGQMQFFERNLDFRLNPDALVPGTLRVISVAMRYLPSNPGFADNLEDAESAYISRYAIGKDYHKLMRKRLKLLGEKIQQEVTILNSRPFVDSGPVLEHAFAEKAGIGWTGKHSLSLNHDSGSWYFLGELFVNIPLPTDKPMKDGCGSCAACISICPTKAIVAPYTVDANRCISYLTIEYDGVIPIQFRKAIGNRIYGCDDCQLICPVNKNVPVTEENAFSDSYSLQSAKLTTLFDWSEEDFLHRLQGSPIRRIG
ncbi:MAG: tRNA epoxyqueuosine(34) reductase QueG, partial [Pseudomonadota bacterium]